MNKSQKQRTGWILVVVLFIGLFCVGFKFYNTNKISVKQVPLRIGVTAYRSEDTYVSTITQTIDESAKEYQLATGTQIRVDKVYAEESQSLQNDQVNHFIKMEYDVICVNIVDRTNAGAIVDWAMEADIPVIFFNREPVEEDLMKWDKAYYIGFSAKESAHLQAEIIMDYYERFPENLDKNGDGIIQYVIFEGEARHQDTLIRTEKVIESLTEQGFEMERIAAETANWSRSQAQSAMGSLWKNSGTEIELIISNNDDMALGCVDFFLSKEIEFNQIVGIDGTVYSRDAIEANQMLGTVSIGGTICGNAIFELSLFLIDGNETEFTPSDFQKGTYLWLGQGKIEGDWVKEPIIDEKSE